MFPFLFGMVHRMTMPQAILGMVLAVCVPILYLLIPDLFYGNASWYEYHSWGLMRNFEDSLVVMLKFHPMCYVHVFLLGMLLARFRILLHDIAGFKELPVIMDFLAPVGYLGLLLVFNVPMAAPPYAKLSARIFALLPLQAAVVLGLAGVEGLREPFLARFFARLNFLETYSYCVYVMQFICMKLWFGQEYDLSFFIFLIASATFVQVFVQKPSDKLWRLSPGQASWLVPAVMSLLLILLSLRWTGVPDHVLPDKVEGDGYMDIRLPLRLEAQDWSATGGGAFINPSLTLLEDGRLVVAARLHRRSSHLSHFHGGSLLEEIWISKILLGSVAMNNKSWKLLNRSGEMPEILLKLWDGLQMADGKPWIYPNMCYREKWLPQNRTMMRFVVTGPEDPKVFPLTRKGSCAESMAGCWVLRASSDFCHVNQSFCEAKCNSRWCSPHEVQVAFNSYTPKEGKSCDHRSVSQMFLASGIDVERPELVSQGQHLKCGQLDHSEKNWIPFEREGQTYVVYSMIPHLVRELKGTGSCGQQWRSIFPKLEEMQSHLLDAAIRGSASAIYLDAPNATARLPEPHYLALFHAADLKVRRYVHYAYRFAPKPPFQILQVSKPLPLQMLPPMPGAPPFAFASGILLREEQVILTYAAGDRESRALLMSLKQLDKYFEYDPACKVKNTFLEFAPVEDEAALRKRRSRSDGPLVVASKSPNASPLLQAVDETRQAVPIDEVDFEMLEEPAHQVDGDSPTHVPKTRKRTSSNGESVAQVAANMGNEPAYVVPTTPSPFLHSSFPPQVSSDFNGYNYMPEMGLPPACDEEENGEIDYSEVAMNGGYMQGMAFMSPEMCQENYMQGMFMPFWGQMGMDGQMAMDGQTIMSAEFQQELQRAAEMQAAEMQAFGGDAQEAELEQDYVEQVQEYLAPIEELRKEEEAEKPKGARAASKEVHSNGKSTEHEQHERSEAQTNGEKQKNWERDDSKWKDWNSWDWRDSSWQDGKHDWNESRDWRDRWDESRKDEKRKGKEGKGKSKAEEKGEKGAGKDVDKASKEKVESSKAGAGDSSKERKVPAIPYERPEGNEPYTTVMLRNIPNKYTREMLIKQLSIEFHGEFDFMYLPIDFKNKCNVGYGFINFRTQDSCERFIGLFHGVDVRKCLPGLNSKKIVEVTPARVQGLTENVRRLKNSPVMNQLVDHPEWMPLLFDEDGVDQPFPMPDQPLPPVKPRGRNREGHRGSTGSREGDASWT
ncbi:Protein MEI2-like 1 (AML1) (MEI2-like protein 1) [Durusdinium trenchii]